MSADEDLPMLLAGRLEAARSLEQQLGDKQYASIQGVSKLRNRLTSELKFLEGIESGKTPLERKYIETSNVTHFENIVSGIGRFYGVQAVFHTFSILDPETDSVLKHTVDIVAKRGDQWVKIISRSAKGICMDWLTGSSRNIFEQADTYLNMAALFQKNFCPPEVVFEFVAGVPDAMASKLRSIGVTVIGEEVPIDTITKVPEDFMEMLMNDVEENDRVPINGSEPSHPPPINLDVSAVFVLISNMTHENGTNHVFDSVLLSQQAEMERKNPARKQLLSQIEGREWIICRTAYDSVRDILSTVGGESEKKRMEELFSHVRLVEDAVSEKTTTLKPSDRINQRSLVIFGSGDYYRAVTATANKHFVSSAYHQVFGDISVTTLKVLRGATLEQKVWGAVGETIIRGQRLWITVIMGKGAPTQRARVIDCRQDAVRAVRYNVDGNYCLTCGSDKSVKLWNPIKGSLLKTYTGTGNEVFDVASSSDNSQVAAGGADKCLTVFDVETGKILRRWRAHAARVNAVAFNEESNVVFSGSTDCTMQAFDNRSRSDKAIQIFNEATDSVLSIDINGGEIVAGSADGNYRLYSIREGNVHIDFMGESVNSVHFTPDSNCILASVQDGNLRLMDKSNGKMLASYTGHKNSEYKVDSCVMASIEEVVSGSEDGFVYVWSLLDSAVIAKLEHPSKVVHSLSAHPKKQHLLTAAGQMVYLWVTKNDEDFEC